MWQKTLAFAGILVMVCSMGAFLAGQGTSASILGSVKDETGAVLPGATVTIRNLDTNISRTILTDAEGRFAAPNLSLGRYEISAEVPGFKPEVRSGFTLTVGREVVFNLTLKIGEISEKVVVTGEAALVETTSGALGGLVESKMVQELPLNGRDLSQLITLQTGATNAYHASQDQGAGRAISISGARPTANVFLLDGININAFHDKTPTGPSGNFLGVEAVREFSVQSNAYNAEFGRGGGGGVFNIVTKSGTNEFHGSVFEFLRNDNLDARNFFDRDPDNPTERSDPPEFKRNQFGFSLGGPVVKNKTFFFGTYESLRERLGLTQISKTFGPDLRQGLLRNPTTGVVTRVTIDPKVVPYLALWPQPNGALFPDGTGEHIFSYSQPTDEDFFQIRGDHQFSDKDAFFARYTFMDSDRLRFASFLTDSTLDINREQFVTLEERKIFSSNWLNLFRFGFSRTTPSEVAQQEPLNPALRFVPTAPFVGSIDVRGVDGLGQGITKDLRFINRFQFIDDVSYSRGDHSIKFGINWERIQFNGDNPARDAGNYTFNSIRDFLLATPRRFRGSILPGRSDAIRGIRQNLIGLYLQDGWRVTPRFTLSAGVRYEFITVPTEVNGKVANIRGGIDLLHQATLSDITVGDPYFRNPSLWNFAPRLSFAWDLLGDGKMALRGGFGVFHYQVTQTWFRTTIFRMPPFLVELQATSNVPFPDIYQVVQRGLIQSSARPAPDMVQYGLGKNPYMMQYNLNLQREVLPSMVVTLGYVGSRGISLPAVADVNVPVGQLQSGRLFFPQRARPNPNFDDIRYRYPAASSWYHSLQLGINRRFTAGFHAQASYTYSKSLDEISGNQTAGDFTGDTGWVPYYHNIKMHKGLSSFDVRNNLVVNFIYDLPFGAGQRFGSSASGPAKFLWSGWQVGGIATMSDGPSANIGISSRMTNLGLRIEYPDLRPGASNNPVLGGPDQYFDPKAFLFPPDRTFGNLARNTLIAPGVATFDFSLTKNTFLNETINLQFRAEFFNLLNRANFGIPGTTVFDNQGILQADAGRITSTITTSRQVQFGLKFIF